MPQAKIDAKKIKSFLTPAKKKSVLKQVMKPKDWLQLTILIVFSVFCWLWVWQAYSAPLDYDLLVEKTVNNQTIKN